MSSSRLTSWPQMPLTVDGMSKSSPPGKSKILGQPKKKSSQAVIDALAARVRSCRERAGVTTAQAAHALGLTLQTYVNRERGRVELTSSEMIILADLFDCQVDELFRVLIDGQAQCDRDTELKAFPTEADRAREVEEFVRNVALIQDAEVRERIIDMVRIVGADGERPLKP